MDSKSENIYLKSRLAAGFDNRGVAAEKLHISYDSLFNYESGKTVPNEDMVFAMAELYQDQMLIVEHFKQTRIGKFMQEKFGLDYQIGELSRAALGFVDGVWNIEVQKLIAIVRDGIISQDELPDAQHMRDVIREIVIRSFPLIWELNEAVTKLKASEKTKTVLPDGHRRKLSCAS